MGEIMDQCSGCDACGSREVVGGSNAHSNPLPNDFGVVLIGNYKVGKSTIFNTICTGKKETISFKHLKGSVEKGTIGFKRIRVYNTPGVLSMFNHSAGDRASRELLIPMNDSESIQGIVVVGDAKNLKRSVSLALQYAEYGLPMLFVLNMVDEAKANGIRIDTEALSEQLGIPVCETVARDGIGMRRLVSQLSLMKPPNLKINHSQEIRGFISLVRETVAVPSLSPRAVALNVLNDDDGIKSYLRRHLGDSGLGEIVAAARKVRGSFSESAAARLVKVYNGVADDIVKQVQLLGSPVKPSFASRLGQWCMTPMPGVPIAAVIVFCMYLFVGTFGATFLVDMINSKLFESFLIPHVKLIVDPIPSAFIRDMIVDPDFGILPTGVFLALGLVTPVLFCFYIAFGVLEDSGYLARLAILLDKVFQKMGLNGKGVIPLVMGFSCVTMALLTTRLLDTEKEKNIVSFLLLLGMPCAPLLAVMFVILEPMPVSATLSVFGLIFLQIMVAGYFSNKMLFGARSPLIMEIYPLRFPKPVLVIKQACLKTFHFMKEALPVFILASFVVFLFDRAGGLALMETLAKPLVSGMMGLPEKSVQVFIKTMIRRESGATEIQHLSSLYTNLQLVVNLLVMTFLSPCINATIVLIKERGIKTALTILLSVMIYAVFIGTVINHACRFLGVTFT